MVKIRPMKNFFLLLYCNFNFKNTNKTCPGPSPRPSPGPEPILFPVLGPCPLIFLVLALVPVPIPMENVGPVTQCVWYIGPTWNRKKLYKVNKMLGEINRIVKVSETKKRGVTKMFQESSRIPLNHILSYGISNPFQPEFGPSLISQHNLRVNVYNWSSSVHWCWPVCKISCATKRCMLWIPR